MLTVVIIPTFNLYKNIGKYKWHPADKTEQNCIWYCSCTFDTFGYICSRQCQPYDCPHSQCLFVGTDLKILLIVIHKSPPKFLLLCICFSFATSVSFVMHWNADTPFLYFTIIMRNMLSFFGKDWNSLSAS